MSNGKNPLHKLALDREVAYNPLQSPVDCEAAVGVDDWDDCTWRHHDGDYLDQSAPAFGQGLMTGVWGCTVALIGWLVAIQVGLRRG